MSDNNREMFEVVFENSPVGLLIVNQDSTLRRANQYMFDVFQLHKLPVEGKRFGNVFNCVAVSNDCSICGDTDICGTCELRGGVMAVIHDGVTITDALLDHSFYINEAEQKKWFKISASRIATKDDVFAVVSFADMTTQKEYEALLHYQLSLDMAMGISNKYSLLQTLASFSADIEFCTVAMIDFDDFKKINDRYGHVIGDEVLQHFCSIVSANIRRQDIFGRFGGEEFMLIFTGAYAGLLVKKLKEIAKILGDVCRTELGFSPTFSVGLAEFSREQLAEGDVKKLIEVVDTNLYEAKRRGKNMIYIGGVSIPLNKSPS